MPVKEWSLPGHEGLGKENWGKVKIDDANIPTKTIDDTSSRRMLEQGYTGPGGSFKGKQKDMAAFDKMVSAAKSGSRGKPNYIAGSRLGPAKAASR